MEFLNDMALFVEVVKAKGFRGAADTIGMPNSTLSRRISALEKAIGLRLLHRTTRKVELTEAGQIYYERCKRIVDEARLAHEQLGKMLAQPSGVLRASLPVDFTVAYLAPLVAEFANLYPGITFDFDLTSRRVDPELIERILAGIAEGKFEIADDSSQDTYIDSKGRRVINHKAIARAKLRIDARKWLAAKLVPKKYANS
jgi:DNA-binding transcriptional LysR family regulator